MTHSAAAGVPPARPGSTGWVFVRPELPASDASSPDPVRPATAIPDPSPSWAPGGLEQEGALAALPELPGERLADDSLVSRLTRRLIERVLEESRRRLRFQVHEPTGRIWVQVIDAETNEVIREIPPERYLDLVARIWELVGLLVDERA